MKLVAKWRNWWKWHRMVLWSAIVAFPPIWLAHPELQALLPAKIVSMIAPAIGAIGLLSEWFNNLPKQPPSIDSGKGGAS